jgi:hypothetical protein
VTVFPCRLDDAEASVGIEATGLVAGNRHLAYVDMDSVRFDGPRIVMDFADGSTATLGQLGRSHDEFVLAFGEARRRARRAALLQWTGDAPIDQYDGRRGEEPVTVVLFADGVTVEGWSSTPDIAPLALVDDVVRDGYTITLVLKRPMAPVVIRQLGRRTDEFLADLAEARTDLGRRTAEAYGQLSDTLKGFSAPDGWAVDKEEAGQWWGALRAAVASGRSEEVDVLEGLAKDDFRLGIKAEAKGASMPFVLAARDGKVAVEGTSEDEARATFVYRTDAVDRLNAVLLITSFRREAISMPLEQLGRWALAARTLEVVQWARQALVARVVHDDAWAANVSAALSS